MTEQLTIEELQALINIVANVPLQTTIGAIPTLSSENGKARPFIDLINKMSQMIDELKETSA